MESPLGMCFPQYRDNKAVENSSESWREEKDQHAQREKAEKEKYPIKNSNTTVSSLF